MQVWDILRLKENTPSDKAGTCHKILWIANNVYVIQSSWNPNKDICESARTTEFKIDMVVKLNERWIEYWSTKTGLQLPKDSYARVIEIWEFHIKTQRVTPNNTLATNRYHRIHLDICPHMSYWYEADWVAETEILTFFEWPAKKPTVVSAFKVWDKVRVNKPTKNKSPNRLDSMDKLDKSILTIERINNLGYIFVKENQRAFHPDRCTHVVTETSGLELHLPNPEPKFKVGDIVRLINDTYKGEGKPKWYSFVVAEISPWINTTYRYREKVWKRNWVEEACLELVNVQWYWIHTIYIDEATAKEHRDLMDDYINKQIADLQGWQHKYLLSLSKTKPMTDTLKELRFEDYTKKNLKDIVASSEMLDDTLQKLCTLRRRISGFESFVDRTLVSLDRAYENHDKEAIVTLLKQASIINKVVNSDLYKATVTGLEWLEKLDKHFEA